MAIALLVVLARNAPVEKCEYKEGKFHQHMPNKFVISFKVSPNCVFIVFFSFFTVIIPACQRLSYDWRPRRFVNMMSLYNRRKFHFLNKHRTPNQVIVRTRHNRRYLAPVISARSCFPASSSFYVICIVLTFGESLTA